MGKYNFDEIIERRGTGSSKWDDFEGRFPGYDVSGAIPMWVADMDFRAPKEVVEAIVKKAQHGIYGYPPKKGEQFDNAVRQWLFKRHSMEIENKWIVATQGVVPAITYAVQEFTDEGDGVLIQPPVYYPFKDRCIRNNKRKAVENPLILKDGKYEIDFEDFERKAADEKTKLFILCSPHNPVGRVWSKEELAKMVEICERNNVFIFSDEIHSDLIMKGFKHTPTYAVSGGYKNIISAYAPSKTFNLAGLRTSAIIVPDGEVRERYVRRMNKNEAGGLNVFGEAALEAAYNYGEDYLEELLEYLKGNIDFAYDFIKSNLPKVQPFKTEGTYFLWLDFRNTGLSYREINKKILEEAKIAVDLGEWFGKEGIGFARLNLACPRSVVEEAVKRIKKAFEH